MSPTRPEVPLPQMEMAGAAIPTSEDIFARQRSIPLVIPAKVLLVGVGGVGSWIGYLLALAGVPELALFDSDRVSATNLNRLPYGPSALGKLKTEALAELIKAVRPACVVKCFPHFSSLFADALAIGRADWLVASTDTWASRKEAYNWAHFRMGYVEASAEGEFGAIAGKPADFGTVEEDQPGYASVPVWIGPAVCAAVMACNHILHGHGADIARLGWDPANHRIAFAYRKEE